jgi:hypothetical protein
MANTGIGRFMKRRKSHLLPTPEYNVTNINQEFFARIIRYLDNGSDGTFSKELAKVRRAAGLQEQRFNQPLAWAIHELQRATPETDINDENILFALTFLQSYHMFAMRWRRLPNFSMVLREMATDQCHHTLVGLMFAAWMCDYYCDVHIKARDGDARAPDFCGHLPEYGEFSIEVKSPVRLRWPYRDITEAELAELIKKAMKSSKGQLTIDTPGFLVLASTLPTTCLKEKYGRALNTVASEWRQAPGHLLGVGFVNTNPKRLSARPGADFALHCAASFYLFDIRMQRTLCRPIPSPKKHLLTSASLLSAAMKARG